jgi:uncharacterized membrane protein YeaQ/YmgE (transglycosylase-associated protein family)
MLAILGWIIAGFIVGAIARLLIPGRQPIGLLMTIVLGIVGALLGGFVSWAFWDVPDEPFAQRAWPGYLLSILGAVLVLWLYLAAKRPYTRGL